MPGQFALEGEAVADDTRADWLPGFEQRCRPSQNVPAPADIIRQHDLRIACVLAGDEVPVGVAFPMPGPRHLLAQVECELAPFRSMPGETQDNEPERGIVPLGPAVPVRAERDVRSLPPG